eukprot:gene5183-315_t
MLRKFAQSQTAKQAANCLVRSKATYGRSASRSPMSASSPAQTEKCLNSVQLLGRVGQDPKVAGRSRKVVQFSMATTVYYQPSGEQGFASPGGLESKTSWHNIAVFRPYLQEKVENYVKKGSRVLVQGSLEYSSYVDESGNQKNSVSVIPGLS